MGFPSSTSGKELACQYRKHKRHGFDPWEEDPLGQEDPLEESRATHSRILAWRILWTEEQVGYSPQGHKKSDTAEAT